MLSIFRKPQTKARCGSAQYDVAVDRDRLGPSARPARARS